MDAHISVRNLDVWYGNHAALTAISADIPRHGITVIMGPSGCGKTTLLKSFNRFLELNDTTRVNGTVAVNGHDIYAPGVDVTAVRKRVGLLAQRPTALPMSIFENVAYGIRIHQPHLDKQAIARQVQQYLEVAGLWHEVAQRLDAPATALSIGQQQRLCLARGLAVEPEIILGDEPTSALDPISSRHIEQKLVELKQRYTTVIVTHTLRQAKRLADYVIFMYLGEIVEAGPAQELFANPQQERTKEYIAGVF